MEQIIATGLNGLVGSKLAQKFETQYQFQNLDISHPGHPVDITKLDQVHQVFENSPAPFVVHFAAFTDVNKAHEQRGQKDGLAYQVNVLGTQNIVQAAADTNKHLIHISTAYVFDGHHPGLYTENDAIAPIEWYGQTKAWAEEAVTNSEANWTILRIDQPFRSDPFAKLDIVRRIVQGLQQGTLYPQFNNHFIGPTYIDDFVKVIDWVIRTKTTGLFHATAGEKWTDFELAKAVQEALHLPGEVKLGDLDEYLKTANRPYHRNTALDTSKLKAQLDFTPLSIAEALQQLEN